MSHDRRPDEATPEMATRKFQDEDGRQWAGSVMSGRLSGGEQHGEVVFVCEDSPSEPKRYATLDSEPAQAAEAWRNLDERGMRDLLRDSEIA